MTGAGYAKERCSKTKGIVPSCKYSRKVTIGSHVVRVSVNAKPEYKRVTVELRTLDGKFEPQAGSGG